MAAQDPTVTIVSESKDKSPKKTLVSVFFVLVLLFGVVAGVVLVGQRQLFRPKASAIDTGSANNLSGCNLLEINPFAKDYCGNFCKDDGCTINSAIPAGACEIRRYHTNDNQDPVVNDIQTGFVNSGGGNLGFIKSCGAEQIDVGCYTDELNHDGVYNDGFKTVAYAWQRYSESCGSTQTETSPAPSGSAPNSGQCSDWCASAQECAAAGGQQVSSMCSYAGCSSGSPCLVSSGGSSGGGTAPAPTATPKSVCGETCNVDSDCAAATTGAATACRNGQCVNQGCYENGGKTTFGTRCDCVLAHQCGAACGGTIGLCAQGLSCTYRGQSMCDPSKLGICVPATGTSDNRGAMLGVPPYDGAAFERRRCGTTTKDANNNYVYHPSFPNHVFTAAEVAEYICNPTVTVVVSPSPEASPDTSLVAQCLDVKVYDSEWSRLTVEDMKDLKPGDTIKISVSGATTLGNIDKARFKVNNGAEMESASKKPSSNEYYIDYTIPQGATGINIQAEVHHDTAGWL